MKLNENTAVSTAHVLLVPYDRHHVLTYHQWMEDPAIREATASDRLTLAAEHENQASWRASHDKLTFIICQPAPSPSPVQSGVDDAPARMVGDINLFLYPYDDDNDEATVGCYVAEVGVMVAAPEHRGKGIGTAAVAAFLHYVRLNLEGILTEYVEGSGTAAVTTATTATTTAALKLFMVKIKVENDASITLFSRLGFEQDGPVNYFGEIKMVLRDVDGVDAGPPPPGYQEVEYHRSVAAA